MRSRLLVEELKLEEAWTHINTPNMQVAYSAAVQILFFRDSLLYLTSPLLVAIGQIEDA